MQLNNDGTVLATIIGSSDERSKKEIKTIPGALEKVTQLRGVNYKWKDDSKDERTQMGLIAQEVEEIFPEIVHTDQNGYKSLAYSQLISALIESIKELNAQNKELNKKIDSLMLQEK